MNAPSGPNRRTYVADASYRMSEQDKSEVMYIFDVAALERLISMLPPEDREDVLSHFQYGEQGSEESPPKLVSFNDPDLQAVLEEVWVPYWDNDAGGGPAQRFPNSGPASRTRPQAGGRVTAANRANASPGTPLRRAPLPRRAVCLGALI